MLVKSFWIAIALILLETASTVQAGVPELKTGDILLQSVRCYVCSLIELEESAPYSHMGIVIVEPTGISVLEAWQKVERVSLREFLARKRPDTSTLVLRPKAFKTQTARISAKSMIHFFDHWFAGKNYDDDFSWSNRDLLGEKYYCSEFVAKFMNHFLPVKFETKPMHFQKYRQSWIEYFKKTPPDGQPGISPADFARSPLLSPVGVLNANEVL